MVVLFLKRNIHYRVEYMNPKNRRNRYISLVALPAVAGAIGLLSDFTRSDSPSCSVGSPEVAKTTVETKGKAKMSSAIAISAAEFDQEVLRSEEPVLADFWAPWCMPCRMLAPTIDQIAEDYRGRVKVVKINTDENQQLAAKYGIRGIPTLIIFKNGEPIDRAVGVQPKAVLSEKLDKAIGR